MEAIDELARNCPHCVEWSDDSFSGRLHELETWDAEEYQKLESALYELARIYSGASSLPREVCWRVLRIFSFTMVSISAHFDPDDGYRIRNITGDKLSEYREQLQLITEGFFKGEMPNPDILTIC